MRFISAAIMAAISLTAQAIQLGPLQLISQDGEPFQARIAVTDLGSISPDQLLPGLAPQAEFERLGIPRVPQLAELSFELVPGDGVAQVLVRSEQALDDLALEFLLELYSPSGRVVKGYSVLFEPPQPPTPPVVPVQTDVPLSGQTIEVGGRTLWRVANDILADGLSVDQVMMGLLRANPQAFERQNINGLVGTSRLRLPTLEGYRFFDPVAAKAEVDKQHLAWASETTPTPIP
ncbi:MAG: type IV pilus assembly protein FimV, partial [Litorivicinus sp.]